MCNKLGGFWGFRTSKDLQKYKKWEVLNFEITYSKPFLFVHYAKFWLWEKIFEQNEPETKQKHTR